MATMLSGERVERYELLGELATGGMATVYLGRQHGPFGFSRTVAIKSMHPQFARDEGFRAMFLDEATLTARIRHPNVVPTLDIVAAEKKVLLVMEYIDGVSLSMLLRALSRRGTAMAPAIAVAIICDVLHGLHAAHELNDDDGHPLHVVHRDVSPQNVHVGVDGLARVLDFGVAKAASRRYVTQSGEVKGKLAYMSGEQLCGEAVDRRTDIYAAGVVLWEALTNRRLFEANNEGELVRKVLESKFDPPSFLADEPLPPELDRVVLKALAQKPEARWSTADEMAKELAAALAPAPRSAVTQVVRDLAGPELDSRAHRLRRETSTPISRNLEPEVKALASILTEHATATAASSPRAKQNEAAAAASSSVLESSSLAASTANAIVSSAPPARRRWPSIVASVLALGALTGGAFFVGSRTAKVPPAPEATPAVTAASSLVARDEPPAAEASAAAPISDSAVPATSASATPASSTIGSARVRTPKKPPPAPRTSRPKSRDCAVPYTVDAHGDRHYKAECVE